MKRLRFYWIPLLLMLVLATSAFANGQMEQNPVIQMNDQPKIFIAPGNAEASVKNLILPFSTITFTAKGQGIKSWTFKVFDSTGKLVYEDSKLETRDRGFLENYSILAIDLKLKYQKNSSGMVPIKPPNHLMQEN